METNNFVNGAGIPLGFGMALAQNEKAMEHFAHLSNAEKQNVIDGTHSIQSKSQMRAYVNSLAQSE